MDAVALIKKLYYDATPGSIDRDLARAVELLKSLPTEDARERVAVYMDGLAQMRSEWRASGPERRRTGPKPPAATPRTSRRSREWRWPAPVTPFSDT